MSDDEGDAGDREEEGRPSQRKKAKTTTTSGGGGGKYVSMKRALAAIQSIAQEHKEECANLEQWVVTRWKEQRCAADARERLQRKEAGEQERKVSKQTEGQVRQQQQEQLEGETGMGVVKRVRHNDMDTKNKQQQDKIMHANVLNVVKSMKPMTDEQVAESLEKLQTRQAELLRVQEQTTGQVERDEEQVKQWLMTLNKHTFLLNDGALRVAKKRRTRGMRPRGASKMVGARQRLTTRWVQDAVRSYLSQDTRLPIERAHAIAQQLERLV
jgi:hypothetical protein